jgi:hypothetical protein
VNNIKMDFQEVEWGSMVKIDMPQDRDMWWVVNLVLNVRFTSKTGNFLTCYELIRFSGRTVLYGVTRSISHYCET